MNIFNSLGSNYNFSYVLKSLFNPGSAKDANALKQFLSEKYGGEVQLFYKGREALTAAIELLNLPNDSEIAINGFTCVAVFNAIRKAGLEPVCLDLERGGGLNFTAKTLERAVKTNKKIKAVVIQNTLGFPCEIEKIEQICKKHKLILIEDLAHCVGTKYSDGREAGTVGDFAVMSFSQDKIIDAVSGGALVVKNSKGKTQSSKMKLKKQKLKDRLYPIFSFLIRKLYPVGLGKPLHFILKKMHMLSDIMSESFYDLYALPYWNAKMALGEFRNLDKQLDHRKKIAKIYLDLLPENIFMLNKAKTSDSVILSANLRFPIFVKNRGQIIEKLKKSGIFLSDIWYKDVAPESTNAVEHSKIILNLPTHINVTEKDAIKVCEIINKCL